LIINPCPVGRETMYTLYSTDEVAFETSGTGGRPEPDVDAPLPVKVVVGGLHAN